MFPFFHTSFFALFFWLLVGHYLADFPLQGDYLAKSKNRHLPQGDGVWMHCLFGHGVIHGGFVALITGSVAFGVMEVIAHCFVDWLKCEQKFGVNFHVDQAMHVIYKLMWAALAWFFLYA